jgi:hypothetical protein
LTVPATVAHCPYCGEASLYFEVDEWDAETRQPTEAGVHVHCRHETGERGDHDDMPYVYWLPVQERVYRWLINDGHTVIADAAETAENLRAWNAGEPIRYGWRSNDVWKSGQGWVPKREDTSQQLPAKAGSLYPAPT